MAAAGAQAAEQLEAVLMADFDDTGLHPDQACRLDRLLGRNARPADLSANIARPIDAEHAEALRATLRADHRRGLAMAMSPWRSRAGLKRMGEGLWLGVVTMPMPVLTRM